MNKPVPDLRSLGLDVPDEVARLIAACTSRDPEARPGNCREIAECFAAAAARENFGVPDVARVMEELFGVERERDESALAEAQQRPVSELSIAPVSNAAPPARARQRAVWAIAGVAIAAGALWVALTQLDRASQTPPSEPLTEARLEAPAALAQPAPQPRPTAQASAPSLASDVADAGRPATSAGAARRTPRAAVKPSHPATPASPLLASPYKRQP